MPRERDAENRGDREKTSLGSHQKMPKCDISQMSLYHEHEAYGTRFHGFMAAEHQSELMFLVKKTADHPRFAKCRSMR